MESTSLHQLAEHELALARAARSGRAARTIHGGQQHVLRQTMIAMAGGHELAEHESPREATLQVIVGKVRLSSAIDSWEGAAGSFVTIPVERHSLLAIDDSVVLLTVITEG